VTRAGCATSGPITGSDAISRSKVERRYRCPAAGCLAKAVVVVPYRRREHRDVSAVRDKE
jgi:hypothetical protein